MTRVLDNGQLEWIFEATEEELENKLEELKKEHSANLRCHEEFLNDKEFSIAMDFLDRASDTLFIIHKISQELIFRVWDGEI